MSEEKNMVLTEIDDEELALIAGGTGVLVTQGTHEYNSGDIPKWRVGEVLRIKYLLPNGKYYRAKCVVQAVSPTKVPTLCGQAYTYTIMIIWVPASQQDDVGKIHHNVCEDCLTLE